MSASENSDKKIPRLESPAAHPKIFWVSALEYGAREPWRARANAEYAMRLLQESGFDMSSGEEGYKKLGTSRAEFEDFLKSMDRLIARKNLNEARAALSRGDCGDICDRLSYVQSWLETSGNADRPGAGLKKLGSSGREFNAMARAAGWKKPVRPEVKAAAPKI